MRLIIFFVFFITACDQSGENAFFNEGGVMEPLSKVNVNLSFVCKHQSIPDANSNADLIFNYARWLQKNNQLKQDENIYFEISRLYRIAAENGSLKSNVNLQNGALQGLFLLHGEERLRFSQKLIDEGVGAGYYFIALYLQHGVAGLEKDQEMALRYMRKAADEGNPQAQSYVGDKLAPRNMSPSVSTQFRLCAAEQGEGLAARNLGIMYQGSSNYEAALKIFQVGVKAGNSSAASFLANGFNGPEPSNELYYMGLNEDKERARRYGVIRKILSNYSYANPKVPEIDEIVPLPPAPLPAWDGKLKWLEEREANIPPEKPSEALIHQMARDKQLDPATGKPLPESPHFVRDDSIKLSCRNGEVCPVSGYWEMEWWDYNSLNTQRIVRFNQGDILPADRVRRVVTRPWPFEDKIVIEEKMMAWRLIAEA